MKSANKNKLIASIATIVVHAIIMVLLFVLCFRTPLPLPGEAGVEVNLGMYEQVDESTSQQVNESTSQQVDEEDILSEDEDVPMIEPEKKEDVVEEINQEPVVEEQIEEKPVVNKRALFQVTSGDSDDTSATRDEAKPESDRGDRNGLKDMNRYEGNGGDGGGTAYDLGGRGAKSISSPSREFSEEGKVVIDIWVDKNGIVQKAEIGKGTTVTDSNMRESARQAALRSVFTEDRKASDIQKGTITYTFIIRQ